MKNKVYCFLAGYMDGKKGGKTENINAFLKKLENTYALPCFSEYTNTTQALEEGRKETLQLLISFRELEDTLLFLESYTPANLRKREWVDMKVKEVQTERIVILSRLSEIDQKEEILVEKVELYLEKIEKKAEISAMSYLSGVSCGMKQPVYMERTVNIPEYNADSPVVQLRKKVLQCAMEGAGDGHVANEEEKE